MSVERLEATVDKIVTVIDLMTATILLLQNRIDRMERSVSVLDSRFVDPSAQSEPVL